MLILNFSHPLTEQQMEQIARLTAEPIEQVIQVAVHFDNALPFLPQLEALMESVPLTAEQWQNAALLINPPSLNFITALLLAELHGRMGYFPAILRLRPVEGALPPRYEVAEILNLQSVREAARRRRYPAER
ncbi:MAG: hypothetical protein ANABAC_1597 [Anaerolineae bacterium]|nr:MAG: hypothetical protein ANABAC_1597 [Anaerolineae bacterium]